MPPSDLESLNQLLASTLALLEQFTTSLSPTNETAGTAAAAPPPIANPPNPLDVLRDSAKLLKAHTTKLALLAINKPFTPSAISKVLREISGTCLPAMMSAAQITTAEPKTYGQFLRHEVHARIRRVLREMETLLGEVRGIGGGAAVTGTGGRRDSLASTGVVWESCDAVIELAGMGVAGLAVKRAEQWRETIRDAIEELREWKEGTDTDAEGRGDGLLDSDDEGVAGDAEGGYEDLFNAANSMPKDRPGLKELVEAAEGRLKKVVLLYTALIKRRLKTYKVGEGDVDVLDQMLASLQRVPDQIDDLASHLYDLDETSAKISLEKCVSEARKVNELAVLDWKREEDEFTTWSRKWNEAIG